MTAAVVATLVVAGSVYGVWLAPPANAVQCVGPPSDFNGDGRSDLAIGEPGRVLPTSTARYGSCFQ